MRSIKAKTTGTQKIYRKITPQNKAWRIIEYTNSAKSSAWKTLTYSRELFKRHFRVAQEKQTMANNTSLSIPSKTKTAL